MARVQYTKVRLSPDHAKMVEQMNEILDGEEHAGMTLTARQLYYQFVSRSWIENSLKSYKRLTDILSRARLGGYVDWDRIEDRGRVPSVPSEWTSIRSIADVAISQFRLDRWRGQKTYVELWVEKQALAGVLEPIGYEFHVTFMANKGYSSQSAMRDAAMRIKRRVSTMTTHETKARAVVLYLGDHDPSGKDMPRDIAGRLRTFGVERLDVDVIALTTRQVKEYDPPPNPAKVTDPRAKAYIAEFGDKSWELDALPPRDLQRLVRAAIESRLDRVKWRAVIEEEERQKRLLSRAVKGMDVVDAKAQPVEGRWCSHPDCDARVYPGDYCPGCEEYVCVDHRTRVVEGADESHDVWCHWEDVDADSDGADDEDGGESE